MKRLFPFFLIALVLLAGGTVFASGTGQSGPAAAGGATTTPVGQYPIQTTVTLNYWLALNANVSPNFANLGDTPFGQALMKNTGVKINFLHPPTGTNAAREQLNLMIADGTNMPDILEFNWVDQTQFAGGPGKGLQDNILLKLNDVWDQWAPNVKNVLSANPDWDKMVKTDDGSYYCFPFLRGSEKLLYSQGIMIRKDWLDDLGLAIPDTLDDYYTVLKAFKEQKNCPAPFTIVWSNNQRLFVSTFGMLKNWYISADNGRVQLGLIQPQYRTWLATMAQWYKEGLIDADVVSIQTAQQNTKMTNGTAGATVASVGSGIGTWTPVARQTNPRYEIIALPDPVLHKGDKRVYSYAGQVYSGQDSAAISASSKNIEIAARFLDYGYTQDGHMLYNFGILGQSYNMINGKAIFSPNIMNNPNGWPLAQSMAAYGRSTGAGPFVQDEGYIEQYYALPEQLAALSNYNVAGADKYVLPAVTPTQAESSEMASIMNDVNTAADEYMTRVILGTEVLTDASWNNYINTLQKMNVQRAVDIQNAALDRYMKR
ncbi:MAG: extracellular solute-binding protein [Treponema sp.]|nr:extracellular solute-binding protein [Treponema sp.]